MKTVIQFSDDEIDVLKNSFKTSFDRYLEYKSRNITSRIDFRFSVIYNFYSGRLHTCDVLNPYISNETVVMLQVKITYNKLKGFKVKLYRANSDVNKADFYGQFVNAFDNVIKELLLVYYNDNTYLLEEIPYFS